jgi:3',5'-cyclic AMP phosphodiesterase CpdA
VSNVIRFFHFTDLHIRSYENDEQATYNTYNNMIRVLEAARQQGIKVDFSVLTGDLSNQGLEESYVRLQSIVKQVEELGGPVLMTPGNHDDRPNFQKYLLSEEPDPTRPHFAVHEFGELKVIVLDSKLDGEYVAGGFEGDQLERLESELAKAPDQDVMLAFHHPLPPVYRDFSDQWMVRQVDADRLIKMLKPYSVLGILTGHVHAPMFNMIRGIPCISGVATAFRSDHYVDDIRFISASGFNIGFYGDGALLLKTVMLPSSNEELFRVSMQQVRERSQ